VLTGASASFAHSDPEPDGQGNIPCRWRLPRHLAFMHPSGGPATPVPGPLCSPTPSTAAPSPQADPSWPRCGDAGVGVPPGLGEGLCAPPLSPRSPRWALDPTRQPSKLVMRPLNRRGGEIGCGRVGVWVPLVNLYTWLSAAKSPDQMLQRQYSVQS
jgi:hypothetical protein